MTKSADLTLDTPDGLMPTYEARPDAEAKGAIVVVQEAFGVTDHIKQIADRLAEAGYYAIAPALFHRQGAPVFAYDDYEGLLPVMAELSNEGISADLTAALDQITAEGFAPSATGIIGFCMGGSVAFFAATQHSLGAAITFYGGGVSTGRFGLPSLIEQAPSLTTPWLGLYGDQDGSIPVDDVEALRQATAQASVDTDIVRYAEAGHGFNCNDRVDHFNAEAASDGWQRSLTFFGERLAR
jgi:carboxymethylenebutenolidase